MIKEECFAIVWGIKSLRIFLEGQSFVFESVHALFQWLYTIRLTN